MSNPFGVTLATVKTYLGYDVDDDSRDAQLTILLDSAFDTLRLLTGRRLQRGVYRDTLEYWPSKVYLREFPIESVSEVKLGDTLLGVDQYRVFLDNGCVAFYSQWYAPTALYGPASYLTIEYVAGYTTLPGTYLMAIYNGIQAADLMLRQAAQYGGFAKRISVMDVGSIDILTPRDASSGVLKDAMAGQLGTTSFDAPSIGAPRLHESEYLGAAP